MPPTDPFLPLRTGGPRCFGAKDPPSTSSSSNSTPDCRPAGVGIRTMSVSVCARTVSGATCSTGLAMHRSGLAPVGGPRPSACRRGATPSPPASGTVGSNRKLVADFATIMSCPPLSRPTSATRTLRSAPECAVTLAADMLFIRLPTRPDGQWPFGGLHKRSGTNSSLAACPSRWRST